ncbi:MAG TPA: flagellar export protein FliJ [Pirellulales bacterium]|jgi:flagellar export protein FliJ|nr:flagellar export protein FliJ [Pirellulales bacterium]
MRRFQFRLVTLLRLREAVRDERRRQLADSIRAAEALAARRETIAGELARFRRRCSAPAGQVNLVGLLDADRYEAVLRDERRQVDERLSALESEIDQRREALLAADRDVRALEQLRDTHERRFLAEDERRSTKELDEAALRRHAAGVGR